MALEPVSDAALNSQERIDSTITVPADGPQTFSDPREAARLLSSLRQKRDEAPPEPPAGEESSGEGELSAEEMAAFDPPQDETTGDPGNQDPAELTIEDAPEPAADTRPPIEAPRSWTQAEKDEFKTYPREAQEIVARREQERESSLRKGQNEAAELRRTLAEQTQAAERVRGEYENALPALLQALQSTQQGEFSDIKTMADVEKMAREDWPRYALWDAQQKRIAAVSQEVKQAQERQANERTAKWNTFAKAEDNKFFEMHPDLQKDPKKMQQAADAVLSTLEKAGLSRQEALDSYNGKTGISLRTAAFQEVALKAALYDQAKAKAAKPGPKPLPPVQKPGMATARQSAANTELAAIQKNAFENPSARSMTDLLVARRASRRG